VRAAIQPPLADATTPESEAARYNELAALKAFNTWSRMCPEEEKEKFRDMFHAF